MTFLDTMPNYGFKIDVLALPDRNSATSAILAMWVQTVHICSYMWPWYALNSPPGDIGQVLQNAASATASLELHNVTCGMVSSEAARPVSFLSQVVPFPEGR